MGAEDGCCMALVLLNFWSRVVRLALGVCRALSLALAGTLAIAGPVAAVTIEIDDVAPDRVERQRAFAEGALPLPGTPDLGQLDGRLSAKGLKPGDRMFIRVFKSESELEVWMEKDGRYVLFDTYPICHWAGTIGPKLLEGDRQNPEGFYSIGPRQLHRIGRWPRSLNIGYPNTFDRAHGRTGSYILVHGGCSSVGCFAMTNAVMAEIFALTEKSLRAGQHRVDIHVFPFRMTEQNLAAHAASPWIDFWRNLKEGFDAFETTFLPPRIGICDRRYVVETQRPGEVGVTGPLALCGASRAALIEPSSQSLAALPQDWPRPLQPYPAPPADGQMAPVVATSAYSGKPLPPLQPLAEQLLLLPPREHRRPRMARLAAATPVLPAMRPCNIKLASCRKFLALSSTTSDRGRLAARQRARAIGPVAGAEISRALKRLVVPPRSVVANALPRRKVR